MIYDVNARMVLSRFIASISPARAAKQLSDAAQHDEFERITQEALKLFLAYQNAPERSAQAQMEYLAQLLKPLKAYDDLIYRQKSWWRKILSFFGFISAQERRSRNALHHIEKGYTKASDDYDDIHYPNWAFRVARFFGLYSIKQMLGGYDSYRTKEKLTYLSHHLMGTTDLNQYKVLQGKMLSRAYHDFANDLEEFIQNEANGLDKYTNALLINIKNKVEQGFELACELDKASLISAEKFDKPIIDGLVLDTTYQVQKAMMSLAVGSSLIIPTGFKGQEGGHATTVECIRGEKGFVFKIINTGAGSSKIESYATIFKTLFFNNDLTRPIKVTSELSFEEITRRNLIEKMLIPKIIASEDSENAMNAEFLKLYEEKKLHDDAKKLTLQINGTCSHSALLEWFKTQIPEPVFSLFQHVTLTKADQRLKELMQDDGHPQEVSDALSALNKAAEATKNSAKKDLVIIDQRLKKENSELREELGILLKPKKNKNVDKIGDFTLYSEKKSRGTKLDANQKREITRANPLDPLASEMKSSFFSLTPTGAKSRTRRAIIAKQIAGHEAFIKIADRSLGG